MLFLVTVVTVVAMGVPVVARLTSPDSWRAWLRTAPSNAIAPVKSHVIAAFTPLDLGPDPVMWPSQRPWPVSRLAEPEWPSKSWDDEHFGTHWRKNEAQAAAAAKPSKAAQARAAVKGAVKAAEGVRQTVKKEAAELADWFQGDPSKEEFVEEANVRLEKGKAMAGRAAAAAGAVAKKAAAVAPKAGAVSQKAAAVARKVETTAQKVQHAAEGAQKAADMAKATLAGTPPSKEEVRALIDEFGLAGAVKQVMERTGWDFRTAAQHLSQNR